MIIMQASGADLNVVRLNWIELATRVFANPDTLDAAQRALMVCSLWVIVSDRQYSFCLYRDNFVYQSCWC